ncbi:ProP Permeases of the major facilitator superfamily [Candidatus Pelagibacterales bacterium]
MFKTLLALPKTVWLIGFISLINDSASEMVYPLLPLYLSSVLLAGPKALGIIEGIAEATSSLLRLVTGVIFDRTRKAKPWLVFGYGIAGLSRPLIAFISSWPALLFIRFADRVGKGLRSSPRDALLANITNKKNYGLVFGFHRAMDNAGAVIGPIIAAILLGIGLSFQSIFLLALAPAILAFSLSLMIKEKKAKPIRSQKIKWSLQGVPKSFKRYLWAVAFFTLACSSDMFLLYRLKELGMENYQIPILWAGVSLVTAVFCTPFSALSDKYGRLKFLAFGWIAYILFYLFMAQANSLNFAIWILFGFYGLFKAATEGVERAYVADLTKVNQRGTAFGWFNLITGFMLFPASFVFGFLYESYGVQIAFLFSAISSIIALVILTTCKNKHA